MTKTPEQVAASLGRCHFTKEAGDLCPSQRCPSKCSRGRIASALRERDAQHEAREQALAAALRSFMCFTHGLCCPGCGAQGRELANFCCKDADCDAGFYGVDADAIRDLLNGGEALMSGTMAQIENDQPVVNECQTQPETSDKE